jgi:hypothetical protein
MYPPVTSTVAASTGHSGLLRGSDTEDRIEGICRSVPANVANKGGQAFWLSDTAWAGSKNTLTFALRCKIA